MIYNSLSLKNLIVKSTSFYPFFFKNRIPRNAQLLDIYPAFDPEKDASKKHCKLKLYVSCTYMEKNCAKCEVNM